MTPANAKLLIDVASSALVLVQQAAAEGRDVSDEELAGLSGLLGAEIAAVQRKVDAMPG